ncbi:MAG: hypothetical protein E7231_10935 [Cellulosilyticum sp.]|nr:hypothetical protein [Cellulosilyticum sp.]
MREFSSINGTIISIENFDTSIHSTISCTLLMGIQSKTQELTYFIVDLETYIVNNTTLKKGDVVTAYYDASLPVPLIYPPRYRAVVISKVSRNYFVKVSSFNEDLISIDGQLKLNLSPQTSVLLPNNQIYLGSLANRDLVVLYRNSTKSIPAQTTPSKVIVLC